MRLYARYTTSRPAGSMDLEWTVEWALEPAGPGLVTQVFALDMSDPVWTSEEQVIRWLMRRAQVVSRVLTIQQAYHAELQVAPNVRFPVAPLYLEYGFSIVFDQESRADVVVLSLDWFLTMESPDVLVESELRYDILDPANTLDLIKSDVADVVARVRRALSFYQTYGQSSLAAQEQTWVPLDV